MIGERLETVRSLPGRMISGVYALPGILRLYWRGMKLMAVAAPAMTAVYIALMLLTGVLPVAQTWLAKLVVDGLANGSDIRHALEIAAIYALTLLASSALSPIQLSLFSWMENQAVGVVDSALIRGGADLQDLVRIERPAFGDDVRMLDMVPYYLPVLFLWVQRVVTGLVTAVGLFVLLASLSLPLALVLFALAVPHMISEGRMNTLQYRAMEDNSRAAREMAYCARTTLEPNAAKEVRMFGVGNFFLARFQERFNAAFGEVIRLRYSQLRLSALYNCLYGLALAGGFWYVAQQAASGGLTLGDIALYLGAIVQSQDSLISIKSGTSVLYEIRLYLKSFFEFVDNAGPGIALPAPGRGQSVPASLRSGIELRHVSFAYPESERLVLEDVSGLLPAGKVTALVGANGAGKSTLVKLLTRMYDPTEGQIILDGKPLSEYDLEPMRKRIAVVYQDFARFSLSLKDNIAVGATEPGEDGERVEQAARWAGVDEVVSRLPKGYDTDLTRRFEGGVDLSGGEWQKVALARGFVRDSPLVILDEPTSALDADAEYRLFQQFKELMSGRTALLISHRFSTVRMADHILVLEDGRVIESGSHAELLALGGRYAELFEMQAGRYR